MLLLRLNLFTNLPWCQSSRTPFFQFGTSGSTASSDSGFADGVSMIVWSPSLSIDVFANIDESRIEWAVNEKPKTSILIYWTDIRWIKNEKDNSVTIYQESSFSKNLSLTEFTEEDKNQMLYLLQEYAILRQIKLINFSQIPSAVA